MSGKLKFVERGAWTCPASRLFHRLWAGDVAYYAASGTLSKALFYWGFLHDLGGLAAAFL